MISVESTTMDVFHIDSGEMWTDTSDSEEYAQQTENMNNSNNQEERDTDLEDERTVDGCCDYQWNDDETTQNGHEKKKSVDDDKTQTTK